MGEIKIAMADDPELAALRAKRMAEMQQQMGGGGQGPSPEEQAEMQRKQQEMKHNMLSQLLDQQARARLNTIALTKPDKARMVEGMLIQMAQTGQIQGKLGEKEFISLLERVNERTQKATTVKFDRRRAAIDDSDED